MSVQQLCRFARNGNSNGVKHILRDHPEFLNLRSRNGNTVLYWACLKNHIDIVKYLIVECMCDVNAPLNHGGWTALMVAVNDGHVEMVNFLLEVGADATLKNDNGETARDLAVARGRKNIISLLDGENIDADGKKKGRKKKKVNRGGRNGFGGDRGGGGGYRSARDHRGGKADRGGGARNAPATGRGYGDRDRSGGVRKPRSAKGARGAASDDRPLSSRRSKVSSSSGAKDPKTRSTITTSSRRRRRRSHESLPVSETASSADVPMAPPMAPPMQSMEPRPPMVVDLPGGPPPLPGAQLNVTTTSSSSFGVPMAPSMAQAAPPPPPPQSHQVLPGYSQMVTGYYGGAPDSKPSRESEKQEREMAEREKAEQAAQVMNELMNEKAKEEESRRLERDVEQLQEEQRRIDQAVFEQGQMIDSLDARVEHSYVNQGVAELALAKPKPRTGKSVISKIGSGLKRLFGRKTQESRSLERPQKATNEQGLTFDGDGDGDDWFAEDEGVDNNLEFAGFADAGLAPKVVDDEEDLQAEETRKQAIIGRKNTSFDLDQEYSWSDYSAPQPRKLAVVIKPQEEIEEEEEEENTRKLRDVVKEMSTRVLVKDGEEDDDKEEVDDSDEDSDDDDNEQTEADAVLGVEPQDMSLNAIGNDLFGAASDDVAWNMDEVVAGDKFVEDFESSSSSSSSSIRSQMSRDADYEKYSEAPAVLPVAREKDKVKFSAYAPSKVERNVKFLLNIWAYVQEQRAEMKRRAEAFGHCETGVKGAVSIERGTPLVVTLRLPKAFVAESSTNSFVWNGEIEQVPFNLRTTSDAKNGNHFCAALIQSGGVCLATLQFSICVVDDGVTSYEAQSLDTSVRYISRIFTCYAEDDELTVFQWKLQVERINPEIVLCMDVTQLRLDSGWTANVGSASYWQKEWDMFTLFWSKHSALNACVEQEWRGALGCAHTDGNGEYMQVVKVRDDAPSVPSELADVYVAPLSMRFHVSNKVRKTSKKGSEHDRVHLSQIEVGPQIGKGAFGIVHRARWQDRDVVVKRVLMDDTVGMENVKETLIESLLMERLPPHKCVVKYCGSTVLEGGTELLVVTDFVSGGSLYDYTQSPQYAGATLTQRWNMACDCVEGLAHLHDNRVVHRDLAARNVLVTSEKRALITDFGMSRVLQSGVFQAHSRYGPVRWMAPESLTHGVYSKKSDIWALGVLLYEVFTGLTPYGDIRDLNTVGTGVVSKTLTLKIPSDGSLRVPHAHGCANSDAIDALTKLLQKCMCFEAKDRPSAIQLLETMRKMRASVLNKDNCVQLQDLDSTSRFVWRHDLDANAMDEYDKYFDMASIGDSDGAYGDFWKALAKKNEPVRNEYDSVGMKPLEKPAESAESIQIYTRVSGFRCD